MGKTNMGEGFVFPNCFVFFEIGRNSESRSPRFVLGLAFRKIKIWCELLLFMMQRVNSSAK